MCLNTALTMLWMIGSLEKNGGCDDFIIYMDNPLGGLGI
jgi:hypothetical protein